VTEPAWDLRAQRAFGAVTGEDETVAVTTDDGWRLALAHYRPVGREAAPVPVMLCHGLAANRFGFDLAPERSLARWLAARGRDVWVVELRGSGRSERPGRIGKKRWGCTFDDYLERDFPALFAEIGRRTGVDRIDLIGHSMGGLLGYAYLGSRGRTLRSLVAIGSSLDYYDSPSDFHLLKRLAPIARRLPTIPLGLLARLGAPMSARVENAIDRFNVVLDNVEPELYRRLSAVAFHDVSGPLLAQLATAFEAPGLRSSNGAVCYAERLEGARIPVLAIAGDADRQCAPSAAERTFRRTTHPASELRLFGRAHGHETAYGHFDLLIGPRAHHEVYPVIERFLESRDEDVPS
jgi:pimeloyl-ACP methyl ester carboxylesterase